MENPDFKKWIKLTFIPFKDGVSIIYEDGLGNKVNPIDEDEFRKVFDVLISKSIDRFIEAIAKQEPQTRQTRSGNLAIPLAVFLGSLDSFYLNTIRPSFAWSAFDDVFYNLFPYNRENLKTQTIFLTQNKSIENLALPINIRSFGRSAENLQDLLKNEYWYSSNPDLIDFGLSMRHSYSPIVDFSDQHTDIVIFESEYVEKFNRVFQFLVQANPRFVILIGFDYSHFIVDWIALQGIPMLCLAGHHGQEDARSFLKDFLYNIIHDLSLHESLHLAVDQNKSRTPDFQAMLFATPDSNQTLRMTLVLESFRTKINGFANVMKPGNSRAFLSKIKSKISPEMFDNISASFTKGLESNLNDLFEKSNLLGMHFHGESTGLIPLSNAEKDFFNNRFNVSEFLSGLQSLSNNPEIFDTFRQLQERRVDITLDEFNFSLVYTPVNKLYPLRELANYKLNVCIGQPSDNSLVVSKVPAIDPLLPDPEGAMGYELDVVVYEKDFILQSPARQKLYLPLLGGSNPVSFQVQTSTANDHAELRVVVFHNNHLLQSFILKAEVSAAFNYDGNPKVSVFLDLSTSSRFNNLEKLGDRDLYIGLNSNSNGSHSFFIKKDSFVQEIKVLNNLMVEKAQEDFNSILKRAYFTDSGVTRFESDSKVGAPLSTEFFLEIEKFARYGHDYYKLIAGNSVQTPLWEKLRDIRRTTDNKIQIGRHDPNLAFPWNVVYDYNTPPPSAQLGKYPVCMGSPFKLEDLTQFNLLRDSDYGCPHNPDIANFCIYGFWGIRNKIEQVFRSPDLKDSSTEITIKKTSQILYTNNVVDDATDRFKKNIQSFTPTIKALGTSDFLMDILWDPKRRPATLIILGHLENDNPAAVDEPLGPRIIPFPKSDWPAGQSLPHKKWIYHDLIFNYCTNQDIWSEEPLPLVFLINCSSAGLEVTSLNSIVQGFHTAGASAIVATECPLTSGLGVRFIEEILDNMYNKKMQLGDAIQLFNKNLMYSGVPLSFAFTCYGNANLKIA